MAFDPSELFERFHGVVYRRCRSLLRNEADAEEAVQDVFVAALSGWGRFKLVAAPLPWLYGVATRHCLQRLRNQSTRTLKHLLLREDEAFEVDPARQLELERFLDGRTLEELELITWCYRDGLTQEEIAQLSGQSRKTVGIKLARLRSLAEASAAEPTWAAPALR